MKKNLVFTLVILFVMSIFGTVFAADEITVKGQGNADKNYISVFSGKPTFSDGASVIKTKVGADGVLTIEYVLQKGGWLGATSEKFMEDWSAFSGLQFVLAGGTGNKIRLELSDANGVSYEAILVDDSAKGKQITVPFTDFKARTDWQPSGVDTEKAFSLVPAVTMNISPLTGKGKFTISNLKLYK
jgi:hypothetical protein